MSVLECGRRGCENIMCDRCNGSYYICAECFEELVDTGPLTSIPEFMRTEKVVKYELPRAVAYDRYDKEFPQD